jgi:phage recombination protein Bet
MTKELATQNDVMSWVLDNGEKLQFTIDDAKNIAGNPNVTNKEFVLFCQLCKADKLNPFTKDAFLIKFGTATAQLITGKNSAVKIASRNKCYKGYKAGIIVLDQNNTIVKRKGSMVYDGEKLIGGWGEAYRDGWIEPAYDEVSIKEYIGKKKDGSTNSKWREMPATMIRKVGLVHALREAFPEQLSNVYDESEVAAIENAKEEKDASTKQKVADIFNKKEDVIDAEFETVTEDIPKEEPDILLNELKVYVKALNTNTKPWCKKAGVEKIEQLPPDIKQKCIDNLKPKYEALQQQEKTNDDIIKDTFGD